MTMTKIKTKKCICSWKFPHPSVYVHTPFQLHKCFSSSFSHMISLDSCQCRISLFSSFLFPIEFPIHLLLYLPQVLGALEVIIWRTEGSKEMVCWQNRTESPFSPTIRIHYSYYHALVQHQFEWYLQFQSFNHFPGDNISWSSGF